MKSPRPISNHFSAFRFSLYSLRSPASPLSPKVSQLASHAEEPPSTSQSTSSTSSSTARGSPSSEKDRAIVGVTVVDSEHVKALRSPVFIPPPKSSPITPWHATFHRNAATTEQETTYLRRNAQIRFVRLTFSVLLFAVAVTLTALQADVLHQYNETRLPTGWFLALWPSDINLAPTFLSLVTGSFVTLLAMSAIAIAAIRSPNPHTRLNDGIFTLLCAVTAPLSLVTLVFASIISPAAVFSSFISNTLSSYVTVDGPSHSNGLPPNPRNSSAKRETIQSFTCALANSAKAFHSDVSVLRLPTESDRSLVPVGFDKICMESKASLAMVITLVGLGAFGLIVAIWTLIMNHQIERLRGEREVIASRHGSRDGKIDGAGIPESLVGNKESKAPQLDV